MKSRIFISSVQREFAKERKALDLQSRLKRLYKCSPRTISKAYTDATKALNECEEMTFSDEEIDKFLPKELRRSKHAMDDGITNR